MGNLKVIYDIQSLPQYVTLEQLHNIMVNGGIIIWDSSLGGTKPRVIQEKNLNIMDVKLFTKESLEERFGKLLDDE